MKRLFAFGCSYTAYSWPTWADFLGLHFDHYENWGLAGLGNRAIAERIVECNIKNRFTSDDTIVVQWSTHLRNDFFHQEGLLHEKRLPGWKTSGSVFNYLNQEIYDERWYKTFFDEEAYFMHTLNSISSTQNLLENTGATWLMTSIGDIRELGTDISYTPEYGEGSIFSDFISHFKGPQKKFGYRVSPGLEVYDNSIWGQHSDRWCEPIWTYNMSKKEKNKFYTFIDENGIWFEDQHFKPIDHITWLTSQVIPKLGLVALDQQYIDVANQVDSVYERLQPEQRFKLDVERLIYIERLNLPRWPNRIQGFTHFKGTGNI